MVITNRRDECVTLIVFRVFLSFINVTFLKQSSRRQSSRSKQYHEMQIQMPSQAEMRLASSDLEDCREIWEAELQDYILETQKRQRQVEMWFEDSCVVRSTFHIYILYNLSL